jgi:hypothetical protein
VTGDIATARQGLRQLLRVPIVFTPIGERGRRGLRSEGRAGVAALLEGVVPMTLASPTGFEPVF